MLFKGYRCFQGKNIGKSTNYDGGGAIPTKEKKGGIEFKLLFPS